MKRVASRSSLPYWWVHSYRDESRAQWATQPIKQKDQSSLSLPLSLSIPKKSPPPFPFVVLLPSPSPSALGFRPPFPATGCLRYPEFIYELHRSWSSFVGVFPAIAGALRLQISQQAGIDGKSS